MVGEKLTDVSDLNLEITRLAIDMEFCGYDVLVVTSHEDLKEVETWLAESSIPFSKIYPSDINTTLQMRDDGFDPILIVGSGGWHKFSSFVPEMIPILTLQNL